MASKRHKADDPFAPSGAGMTGGGGKDDPLIAALIEKLPAEGPWLQADRDNWVTMLKLAFDIAYGSGTVPHDATVAT